MEYLGYCCVGSGGYAATPARGVLGVPYGVLGVPYGVFDTAALLTLVHAGQTVAETAKVDPDHSAFAEPKHHRRRAPAAIPAPVVPASVEESTPTWVYGLGFITIAVVAVASAFVVSRRDPKRSRGH